MPFHYTNKKTGEVKIFSNYKYIPNHIDVTISQLVYCFTRKKLLIYENETHKICKLPLIKK